MIMYAGIFATMFFAVALGVMFFKTPQERLTTQRLNSAVKEVGPSLPGKIELPTESTKDKMGSLLVGFSQWLKTTVGVKDNPKAEARFQKAGVRSQHAGDYYFAARILGPAAGVMMGSFSPWNPLMIAVLLAAAGYFG